MNRNARPGTKSRRRNYRMEGTQRIRVTVYLSRFEIDWLRNVARSRYPLTCSGKARSGIVITELIRDGIERVIRARGRE